MCFPLNIKEKIEHVLGKSNWNINNTENKNVWKGKDENENTEPWPSV